MKTKAKTNPPLTQQIEKMAAQIERSNDLIRALCSGIGQMQENNEFWIEVGSPQAGESADVYLMTTTQNRAMDLDACGVDAVFAFLGAESYARG